MKNFIKYNYDFKNTKQMWMKQKEEKIKFLPFWKERNLMGKLLNSEKLLKYQSNKNMKLNIPKINNNKFSKNHIKNIWLQEDEKNKHIKNDDFLYNKNDLQYLENNKISALSKNNDNHNNINKENIENNININFSKKHWVMNDIKEKRKNLKNIKFFSKIKLVDKKNQKEINEKNYNWGHSIDFIMKKQPSYTFKKNNINKYISVKNLKTSKKNFKKTKQENLINYLNNISKKNFLTNFNNNYKKKKNYNETEEFKLFNKINKKITLCTDSLDKIRKAIHI